MALHGGLTRSEGGFWHHRLRCYEWDRESLQTAWAFYGWSLHSEHPLPESMLELHLYRADPYGAWR